LDIQQGELGLQLSSEKECTARRKTRITARRSWGEGLEPVDADERSDQRKRELPHHATGQKDQSIQTWEVLKKSSTPFLSQESLCRQGWPARLQEKAAEPQRNEIGKKKHSGTKRNFSFWAAKDMFRGQRGSSVRRMRISRRNLKGEKRHRRLQVLGGPPFVRTEGKKTTGVTSGTGRRKRGHARKRGKKRTTPCYRTLVAREKSPSAARDGMKKRRCARWAARLLEGGLTPFCSSHQNVDCVARL